MKPWLVAFYIVWSCAVAVAQRKLTVSADKPVASVSPTMWGVFFEDINFSADGGLYAELVKNRSFEFPSPLMGWKENKGQPKKGSILIINKSNQSTNTRYASITLHKGEGNYSLSNEGFRGIGIHKNKQYDFSVMARMIAGSNIKITVQLISYLGKVIGQTQLENFHSGWEKYSSRIHTTDSAQRGKLNLLFEGEGTIELDIVSLFPKDTWKNRPGGLRNDLVQKIADLNPGFIRFPGGCIVEGKDLNNRYQWKTTVGATNDRSLIMNRWNVEFRHRPAPDYFQSFGLGFYEYFLLSEDLGAAPLPIINCGMACQYNSGEVVAMDALQPYIDDALDLIEFANGAVTTPWGKLRSDMGHPQPFHLKYIGVGNEQWEHQYIERYKIFEQAILSRYPQIQIVSGAGPAPDGELFNYAWKELKQLQPSFIDEHYYKPPSWFFNNATRYDNYDRKGPKVFAGEYAAHSTEKSDAESRNNWESALAEAAFMTGLERNADVVQMSSYAPLLAHVDAWQWRPDLIWFDNLNTVATPNYYVQKLFSTNKGTDVVNILENNRAITGQDSLYASAVIDRDKRLVIVKLVNSAARVQQIELNINGIKWQDQMIHLLELAAKDLYSYNSIAQLSALTPVERTYLNKGKKVIQSLLPYSVTVIKIPYK